MNLLKAAAYFSGDDSKWTRKCFSAAFVYGVFFILLSLARVSAAASDGEKIFDFDKERAGQCKASDGARGDSARFSANIAANCQFVQKTAANQRLRATRQMNGVDAANLETIQEKIVLGEFANIVRPLAIKEVTKNLERRILEYKKYGPIVCGLIAKKLAGSSGCAQPNFNIQEICKDGYKSKNPEIKSLTDSKEDVRDKKLKLLKATYEVGRLKKIQDLMGDPSNPQKAPEAAANSKRLQNLKVIGPDGAYKNVDMGTQMIARQARLMVEYPDIAVTKAEKIYESLQTENIVVGGLNNIGTVTSQFVGGLGANGFNTINVRDRLKIDMDTLWIDPGFFKEDQADLTICDGNASDWNADALISVKATRRFTGTSVKDYRSSELTTKKIPPCKFTKFVAKSDTLDKKLNNANLSNDELNALLYPVYENWANMIADALPKTCSIDDCTLLGLDGELNFKALQSDKFFQNQANIKTLKSSLCNCAASPTSEFFQKIAEAGGVACLGAMGAGAAIGAGIGAMGGVVGAGPGAAAGVFIGSAATCLPAGGAYLIQSQIMRLWNNPTFRAQSAYWNTVSSYKVDKIQAALEGANKSGFRGQVGNTAMAGLSMIPMGSLKAVSAASELSKLSIAERLVALEKMGSDAKRTKALNGLSQAEKTATEDAIHAAQMEAQAKEMKYLREITAVNKDKPATLAFLEKNAKSPIDLTQHPGLKKYLNYLDGQAAGPSVRDALSALQDMAAKGVNIDEAAKAMLAAAQNAAKTERAALAAIETKPNAAASVTTADKAPASTITPADKLPPDALPGAGGQGTAIDGPVANWFDRFAGIFKNPKGDINAKLAKRLTDYMDKLNKSDPTKRDALLRQLERTLGQIKEKDIAKLSPEIQERILDVAIAATEFGPKPINMVEMVTWSKAGLSGLTKVLQEAKGTGVRSVSDDVALEQALGRLGVKDPAKQRTMRSCVLRPF